MQNNRNISAFIVGAAIVIATAIVAFVADSYLQKKLVNEAINGCAESASQSDPNGGFNGAVYQICIEDKGYKTKIR